jgi:hypothetical protein
MKTGEKMDSEIRSHFENLNGIDKEKQYQHYLVLLPATEKKVDWAYEVWDELVAKLNHKDNHLRTIATQLLCNLAISDPQEHILRDFDKILAVTRDKRFVTARHSLQVLWKIGLAGEKQKAKVLAGLSLRFAECGQEKNGTLLRYDIIVGLRQLFDSTNDATIKELALQLIEQEQDSKYRKKYAGAWKDA